MGGHGHPRGVRVVLKGAQFDELIVGCDDPEGVVAKIRQSISARCRLHGAPCEPAAVQVVGCPTWRAIASFSTSSANRRKPSVVSRPLDHGLTSARPTPDSAARRSASISP